MELQLQILLQVAREIIPIAGTAIQQIKLQAVLLPELIPWLLPMETIVLKRKVFLSIIIRLRL